MDKQQNTLGGFEAILDSFIPNPDKFNQEIDEPITDEELDAIKNNSKKKVEEPEEEIIDDPKETEEEEEIIEEPKRKPGRPKKEEVIEEPEEDDDNTESVVSGFFDAMAEKLGWEFSEEELESKPKDVDQLIEYFQNIIEENSKPDYASEEMEALDAYVRQGGDLRKYLTIDAELDLEGIDMEEESNQKAVVKMLLTEKGYTKTRIDKMISRYEDSGVLEDEATDALEDLKEIREHKKEQLLAEQKKQHAALVQRQQQFYNDVVDGIKGLKNIRGIAIPEKDKKVLMEYILKPDTDGKTKYQKDYAKGGVKNLIESAYFTMNADKFVEAAKREGNNSAIQKFKNSLKSTSINTRSKQVNKDQGDDAIWSSFTHRLRI